MAKTNGQSELMKIMMRIKKKRKMRNTRLWWALVMGGIQEIRR